MPDLLFSVTEHICPNFLATLVELDEALVAKHHALAFIDIYCSCRLADSVDTLECWLAPDSSHAPGEGAMIPFRMQVLKWGRIAG